MLVLNNNPLDKEKINLNNCETWSVVDRLCEMIENPTKIYASWES